MFNKYFLDFGFPKRILHDQIKEFDNKLFKRLSEITCNKPSLTTIYHPMGNRLCERMNRTIINVLKTVPATCKSNWKNHIKKLTFAYNSTKHRSTNYSPYFLLFGRNGRLLVDWMFDINTKNDIYEVVSCHLKLPIYQIKPENGGNKIRTVYRNFLMKCNDLPVETQSHYSTLTTSNKKKKKKTINK